MATCFLGQGMQGKVGIYLDEVKRLGIGIKGPSINHSLVEFSVEATQDGPSIRYGLGGIKNVGEAVAAEIVRERQRRGKFESLESFVFRMGKALTKKALESLIRCGALDELGTRFSHLDKMDQVLSQRVAQPDTQMSLFGGFEPPKQDLPLAPAPTEPAPEAHRQCRCSPGGSACCEYQAKCLGGFSRKQAGITRIMVMSPRQG